MRKKTKKDQHVTYTVFTRAIEALHKRFDAVPTKDDLKGFSTKDDLKGFATKDDFNRLALAITENGAGIRKLQETKADKADINRLNNRFDGYADKLNEMTNIPQLNKERLRTTWKQLDNHETRLAALEKQPPSAA